MPCRHREPEVLTVTTELGFAVTLDVEILDPLGELHAVMSGRPTFTRYTHSGAVHHRPAYKIRERPAGTRPGQSVHALHRCPSQEGDR